MDYLVRKQKNIAYCILNKIPTQQSSTSQEIARNLSDFFLSCIIDRGYDIFIDENSDTLLKRVANDKYYTHAVVVVTGTHTGLSERLFEAVENKCLEHFTVAGHILDRSKFEGYYEIHEQFFITNMDEYRRLNCPDMGQTKWHEEHIKIEPIRSEEIVDDNPEIPMTIQLGTKEKAYKHKMHGHNLIDIGLKNNAKFVDIGTKIRASKKYLYYEYEHVFHQNVPEIFNYELISNNIPAPWNTDDPISFEHFNIKVDHFISTGTGLNWIYNLAKLGYHANTKITFIDKSFAVLDFMKNLIEKWNGINYPEFYIQNLKFIPDSFMYDKDYLEQIARDNWTKFLKEFPDFEKIWNEIKNLKYEFKIIDLFGNNKLDFIRDDDITFINVSNVFNFIANAHYASVKFRVSRENGLIAKLQKINGDIILHMPTRIGKFYKKDLSETDKISTAKVRDFAFWDINEFNSPPWQVDNWKSYCPITKELRILK